MRIAAMLIVAGGTGAVAFAQSDQSAGETSGGGTKNAAAAASNSFGIELYRALCHAHGDKNLFISPYSVSIALAVTAEGARGPTENEMARVLHLPNGGQDEGRMARSVHEAHAALAQHFR